MKMRKLYLAAVMGLAMSLTVSAQEVVYEDNFNTDTSGNYSVLQLDRPDTGMDNEARFAYDYSVDVDGIGDGIPPAPNSTDGDTIALWMSANFMFENNAGSFLNVYTNQEFSGNYQVFVDVFGRVNADAAGSTNQNLVGINHSGEKLVSLGQGTFGFEEAVDDTDGYFWSAAPDLGWGSFDYALLEGGPTEDGTDNSVCGTWFIETPTQDCAVPGDGEDDGVPRPYNELFSLIYFFNKSGGSYTGASANHWTELRMDFIDGVVTVYLKSEITEEIDFINSDFPWVQTTDDGFIKVVEYDDADDTYPSGKIMFGYEDTFDSRFTSTQFGLYDNLKVISLGGSDVDSWSVY
ncbi:MAG: hypothetical protein P9L94_04250 [Candidatus Hinthialibacter antarcticus]|nr:hypothetical protein [Candidatus Hinthialibacter antarcticus]